VGNPQGQRNVKTEAEAHCTSPDAAQENRRLTVNDVPWLARLPGFNQTGRWCQVNIRYHPDEETAAGKTYDKVKDSFIVR
jgi:hypothetical protein